MLKSDIVVCDTMPEDRINTISYSELVSDPIPQDEVRKNELTWEEYSKKEKYFEALAREAEGRIYDLMIEEQEKNDQLQEQAQWKAVQDLIWEYSQNNRKQELADLLKAIDRPEPKVEKTQARKKKQKKQKKQKRSNVYWTPFGFRSKKSKRIKPPEKIILTKPEMTEEKKEKVKKRAKGLAAYIEKFL